MILLKETELMCRKLVNRKGLSASLNYQARILSINGNLDKAMELYID